MARCRVNNYDVVIIGAGHNGLVCGAYLAVTAISLLDLPFAAAVLFIVVAAALIGVLVHVFLIQPLSGRM